MTDDYAVPLLLGGGALAGLLLALTGLGLGIAAFALRRRTPAAVPPPWPVQA
ncbi:hypothetical protein [Streptomyces lincolnensis]|uniref:hypothetical protein n=1 Tax=Streptomyces lincolnensis TaxID=1915 RepID=UPI0026CC5855|nr:hypothetical protein [Streptomyces lincolnensis]